MTQALHTVLEDAERQRDEALAALQQAEALELQMRLQAEQLQAYRVEYEARNPARGGRAAPIEVLRCHIGFMQRLHQAQVQQQGQLAAAQSRVAQQREALVERETQLAAVRKLIERRGREHQRVAQTQEQRRNDEVSQQLAWINRTTVANPH